MRQLCAEVIAAVEGITEELQAAVLEHFNTYLYQQMALGAGYHTHTHTHTHTHEQLVCQ